MQTYYVDLSLSTTGNAGTSASPFSWVDVQTLLQAIPTSTTGLTIDIVFRCRGRGDLLNVANSILLSNLTFVSNTGGIRFVADDPGQYGLPILGIPGTGTQLGANMSWFKIVNGTGVRVDFVGFVWDMNASFGNDGYNLLEVSGGASVVTNFSKNILIERGVGHRYVYVHGTDAGSRTVTVGNTICYCAASSGAQEFAKVDTGSVFTGLNFALQSDQSNAIVLFTQASGTLYTHANAFGLRASSLVYTGVAANQYSPDVAGINITTQGIYGINAFGSDVADLSDISGGLTTRLTYSQSSPFWPVNAGLMLRVGSVSVPSVLDLGMLETDAFGYQRAVATQDAGAFQKSGVISPATVHVDLSTATTGGNGTDAQPIGISEFQTDYARRAPVDYALTYVLRNNNVTNPITAFDFGPVSPNTTATERTYGGAGSITITGYKTYNTPLPILSANRLTPNANLTVILERLKLEFAAGTHFISGSNAVTTGMLRLRACVMRSRSGAQGYFIRSAVGTSPVHLRGCTVVQGHSTGTGSGIFSYSVGTANTIHLCAMNLDNQAQLGTGPADIRACSISTGLGSAATWSDATVDSLTNMNALNAFEDPNDTDYSVANFMLTSTSTAIAILYDATAIVNDIDDLAYDCRGMKRSAFPNGSKAADAGAYEYDFYVPDPEHRYLDLGKVRTGSGTQTDKWGPSDFQAWCATLPGTRLDHSVIVYVSRSGVMDLVINEVDADPNGAISLVADGSPPLWESAARGNLVVSGSTGLTVQLREVMLHNETGAPAILAQNCLATDFDVVNSIVDNKRKQTSYIVTLLRQPVSGTDTLTVTGTGSETALLTAGTDFFNGTALSDTAALIAAKINSDATTSAYATASAWSNTVAISVPFGGAVSGFSSSTFSVAAVTDVAVVNVDTALVRGCSFNDEVAATSTVQAIAIRATTANVGYTAFQGQIAGSAKTLTAVHASAGISFDNRVNGYTNIVDGGVTDTGSVAAAAQLFAQLRAPDTYVEAFNISAPECLNAVSVLTLPEVFDGVDVETDILGRFRSRAYVDPAGNYFDAGAVEQNYLDNEAVFTGDVGDPITALTDVGYSLNARALTGDFGFTLSGYAFARGGYVYWDPTKPQPVQDPGSQAHAILVVGSGTLSSESVTVTSAIGTTTVHAGTDFETTGTPGAIALAIATALRSVKVFNEAFWILVDGATIHIYSWRYGTSSAGNHSTVTGSAITRTQDFVTGTEPLGVQDQVYPVSGYAPWYGTETPDPRSKGFIARLETGAFVYGELVVIATVALSAFANEVGTEYVYARVRMPISTKHSRRTLVQRVLLAY
jgi:hypothetical protein